MSREELVELYLDWALGREDDLCQSDVILACIESKIDYKEIEKIALDKR